MPIHVYQIKPCTTHKIIMKSMKTFHMAINILNCLKLSSSSRVLSPIPVGFSSSPKDSSSLGLFLHVSHTQIEITSCISNLPTTVSPCTQCTYQAEHSHTSCRCACMSRASGTGPAAPVLARPIFSTGAKLFTEPK